MANIDFLKRLLDAPGPSGFETRAARVWRAEAKEFADSVSVDVTGNSYAVVNPEGSPRVFLVGHIDEIGLQVTHIDEQGYLYVDEIGGWDSQVLVAQRVRVMAKDGDVPGVIGKKPIHLLEVEERAKVTKTKQLWVDVGADDRDAVEALGIRVGDPMVLEAPMVQLAGDRIASRAVDDRVGAYVVLEAARLLSEQRPEACVVAVASVQEEIGYTQGGVAAGVFDMAPDVALAIDVTFSTDVPDVSAKEIGEHKLGGGPVLARGSAVNPLVFEKLADVAAEHGIDYTIQATPRTTRTDADSIHLQRAGVATGLISIPNRYMHSPSEIVALSDLDSAAKLMAGFVASLNESTSFVPE